MGISGKTVTFRKLTYSLSWAPPLLYIAVCKTKLLYQKDENLGGLILPKPSSPSPALLLWIGEAVSQAGLKVQERGAHCLPRNRRQMTQRDQELSFRSPGIGIETQEIVRISFFHPLAHAYSQHPSPIWCCANQWDKLLLIPLEQGFTFSFLGGKQLSLQTNLPGTAFYKTD